MQTNQLSYRCRLVLSVALHHPDSEKFDLLEFSSEAIRESSIPYLMRRVKQYCDRLPYYDVSRNQFLCEYQYLKKQDDVIDGRVFLSWGARIAFKYGFALTLNTFINHLNKTMR